MEGYCSNIKKGKQDINKKSGNSFPLDKIVPEWMPPRIRQQPSLVFDGRINGYQRSREKEGVFGKVRPLHVSEVPSPLGRDAYQVRTGYRESGLISSIPRPSINRFIPLPVSQRNADTPAIPARPAFYSWNKWIQEPLRNAGRRQNRIPAVFGRQDTTQRDSEVERI